MGSSFPVHQLEVSHEGWTEAGRQLSILQQKLVSETEPDIPMEELIDVGGVGSDNSDTIRHHKPSYFDFDNGIRSSGNIHSLSAHSNFYALSLFLYNISMNLPLICIDDLLTGVTSTCKVVKYGQIRSVPSRWRE
jgi:hypothetical protein